MTNYFKHQFRTKDPATIVAMIVFGIIAITGLAILFGFVLMWLWNAIMPELFDLPVVTYWQAVGIFILAKLLFGGIGSGSSSSSKSSKGDSWSCDDDSKKKSKSSDFKKWELYDKFWKEEGEEAYKSYQDKLAGNISDSEDKMEAKPLIDSSEENPEK